MNGMKIFFVIFFFFFNYEKFECVVSRSWKKS